MKKILITFIISIILVSCQSTQDAFSLKKRNNTDEFLVEKKNPLVMPPDFDKLPTPKNLEETTNVSNDDSIKDLIGSDNQKSSDQVKDNSGTSSIEKLILDKIN